MGVEVEAKEARRVELMEMAEELKDEGLVEPMLVDEGGTNEGSG